MQPGTKLGANQDIPSLSPEMMKRFIAQDAKVKAEDQAILIANNLAVAKVRAVTTTNTTAEFEQVFNGVEKLLERVYLERGLTAMRASFEIKAASDEAPK